MDWKQAAAVAAGGGLGSLCRWGVGQVAYFRQYSFPISTLVVNMVGCLLIGMAFRWQQQASPSAAITCLLVTGFLGGFTTFSAFGLELFHTLKAWQPGLFLLYGCGSVVVGVLMVWLGFSFLK